jgi:hypothetical protein
MKFFGGDPCRRSDPSGLAFVRETPSRSYRTSLTPRNTRSFGSVAATMGTKWHLAFVICATSGCVTSQGLAIHRASREFRCPEPKIAIFPRPDISEDVVDVRGCGHVAQYNCFVERDGTHCVREPIDTKDVEALMSLPDNPAPMQPVAPREYRPDRPRICRDSSDFNTNRDCVAPAH